MLKEVYFPRQAMPLDSIAACVVESVLAFLVKVALMFYFGDVPPATELFLPLLVLLVIVASL